MALLPIIYAPDNRLKLKCQEVHEIDESVCKLMDDMLETMYAAPGIGLSAPQVGDNRRILVCDVAREKEAPNDSLCRDRPAGQASHVSPVADTHPRLLLKIVVFVHDTQRSAMTATNRSRASWAA